MNLSQCGNWQSRSVASGQQRPIWGVRAVSALPPLAAKRTRTWGGRGKACFGRATAALRNEDLQKRQVKSKP